MAYRGMVTSPNALASQSGIHILRQGGTAIESAVAIAASLAVVYPHMCSLGGDAFWLIANAKEKSLIALNASGRAGLRATRDFYRKNNCARIPYKGYRAAITVPGMVSGLEAALRYNREHLGETLPLASLFADAIDYAANGLPQSTSFVRAMHTALTRNAHDPKTYPLYQELTDIFLPNGKESALGDPLIQSDLADVLRTLVREGLNSFYTGSVAQAILSAMQKNGGLLTEEDFARNKATWDTPISVAYREYQAFNTPPNSQGMASLAILNCLNNFDVARLGEGTADYYHLLVEATKEAFRDRDRYLTDPDFSDIPVAQLLSEEHGRSQAARIAMDRAAPWDAPLDPMGDTVWFGVVDSFGNAVSCIQSIYHDFGAGIVPKGTGIILQNRGTFFSLDPAHPNRLEPGKRTFHTLNPAMLYKDGAPYLIYGTMGGEGQPQTQAAIVTRLVDFGLSPSEAIYAPRWLFGSAFGAPSANLTLESRIDEACQKDLASRGHSIRLTEPFSEIMGHAGAIRIEKRSACTRGGFLLQGASDVRSDGAALGY